MMKPWLRSTTLQAESARSILAARLEEAGEDEDGDMEEENIKRR